MTPQELKLGIIQLALQGKLSRRDSSDSSIFDFIKSLPYSKKKKYEEISDEEKVFDIPETWEWIRLGCLIDVISGVSYDKGHVAHSGLRILRGGNIQNNKILISDDDVFLPESYFDLDKMVRVGDTIIVASTGSKKVIGKPGYVKEPLENTMIGAFLRICRPKCIEMSDYLNVVFQSNLYRKRLRDLSQGTNINNVKESYITELPIPLPPLEEQKRIVAKIEELLPLVDRYEEAWSKLEKFNKKFPFDMEKSLLKSAFEGKIEKQSLNNGNANELLNKIIKEKNRLINEKVLKREKELPPITEEELLFDIPSNWQWARLSDVLDVRDGTHDSPKYHQSGIPFVTSKNLVDGKIDFNECKLISLEDANKFNERSYVDDGDILFAMIGTIGNPVIVKKDREFCIKNMALIKNFAKDLLNTKYVYYYLRFIENNLKSIAQASVQSFVSLSILRKYLIPIPPLEEQQSIVTKLEELLPLCRKLVK